MYLEVSILSIMEVSTLFSAYNCSTGIKAEFGNRCSNLLVQYITSTWYSELQNVWPLNKVMDY